MKKVIGGLTYNTETATEIGRADWGYASDFKHFDEGLYVTKKGRFFVAGEGGALSRYAVSCGSNFMGGGSAINPLSTGDALAWAERNDVDADVIAKHWDIKEA